MLIELCKPMPALGIRRRGRRNANSPKTRSFVVSSRRSSARTGHRHGAASLAETQRLRPASAGPRRREARVLELSPARWTETKKDPRTQQLLAADVFRQLSLGAYDDQLDRA